MTRRRYTEDFVQEAVALVRGGRRVAEVADTLGIPHGSLWNWVTRAQGPAPEPASGAEDRIDPTAYAALQRRVADLERENEFLGKASAYFAGKAHRKP